MRSGTQSPGHHSDTRLAMASNRKRLKLGLSILGATIILVSFFANDLQREELKSLIDSIDAAANAYILRMEWHADHADLVKFTKEFEEFAKHPQDRLSMTAGGGFDDGPAEPDYETLDSLSAEIVANSDLLLNIGRLAEKLPANGPSGIKFTELLTKVSSMFNQLNALSDQAQAIRTDPQQHGEEEIKSFNEKVENLNKIKDQASKDIQRFSSSSLEDADKERKSAERSYDSWTIIFRVLYVVGWCVGVLGLLLTDEPEKLLESMSVG